MHSEWELLMLAEDISLGDRITVSSDGDDFELILVKHTAKFVYLQDDEENLYKFSTETLECHSEDFLIVGKA